VPGGEEVDGVDGVDGRDDDVVEGIANLGISSLA
jgi:hypothetical protein